MKDKKYVPSLRNEETRVDLGDDLLTTDAFDHSQIFVRGSSEASNGEELNDLLESAKILVNEGLFEDAKRTLRQVLVQAPENKSARNELDRIHELELKQIFGDHDSKIPFKKRAPKEKEEFDSESLMRQLDQDLDLGIFTKELSGVSMNSLSLFQDPQLMANFCTDLENTLIDASIQDWIDLGIGFLEMDLYEVSVRLFKGASKRIDSTPESPIELRVSANCALAFALILAGRPFEAIAKIQPLLGDIQIKIEQKTELFYLMGRTYEAMNKNQTALEFYFQVIQQDARYRDVDQRARRVSLL